MTTTIALPLKFRLPDGWEAADPAASGAPKAAFVAVHPASRSNGVTANITLTELTPTGALDDIADQALGRLVRIGREVTLVRRQTAGSLAAPAVLQLVTLLVSLENVPRRMTQHQALLRPGGDRGPVVEVVLTATPEQYAAAAASFGEFVGSIRLDT